MYILDLVEIIDKIIHNVKSIITHFLCWFKTAFIVDNRFNMLSNIYTSEILSVGKQTLITVSKKNVSENNRYFLFDSISYPTDILWTSQVSSNIDHLLRKNIGADKQTFHFEWILHSSHDSNSRNI